MRIDAHAVPSMACCRIENVNSCLEMLFEGCSFVVESVERASPMRFVQRVSEDEMVAAFLRGEIGSPRYGRAILDLLRGDQLDRTLVDHPDLTDPAANGARRKILVEYRGFGRDADVFTGFPDDVRWYRALLSRQELTDVRYINYDYWNDLSGGSRLVVDAVRRIKNGIEIFGVSNAGIWHVAGLIAAGESLPEPILVGRDEQSPLTILEGHTRLTAYLMAPESLPDELPLIVGFSPTMDK
jgi:hypothetical protein